MKKYLILGLILGLLVSVGAALAGKPVAPPAGSQAVGVNPPGKDSSVATVAIPSTAVEVAPGIFSLGTAVDNGKLVEGYAFVDYKKGYGKPTGCNNDGKCQGWEDATCADCTGGGNGNGDTDDSSCYGFFAKGAKWKVTEPYIVASDIDALVTARDLDAWDSQVAFNVFGNQDLSSVVDGVDTNSTDGKNEVMYGNISNQGVIAMAVVWGIFSGPPFARELVEWDVIFDNVDYPWGDATIDSTVMDFENIATHEFGHAAGMGDLYEGTCSEQTMYGYASYGETKKRTLEAGDIKGIQGLYK